MPGTVDGKGRTGLIRGSYTTAEDYAKFVSAVLNGTGLRPPAAGLVTSVRDLARISIALDADQLLEPATKAEMLSPTIEIYGPSKTYGLGWFVQTYQGVKLEWHYGLAQGHSAFIIRVPERGLTFVVAANTSRLSGAYDMAAFDIMATGPGRLFVEWFVLGNALRTS